MATLPPKRNTTPTKVSKQKMSPLQTLLLMGFPKHRAEKALAATGHRGVQLATDWLLSHVNDPLLDDNSPREYILYCCPTDNFLKELETFWNESKETCGWNGAHNFTPHITLVSFFKAPDEDSQQLAQGLQTVMDRQGARLNEPLKLETYMSPNFMGFFVAEEHADYLKRIAMQYVKEVSNAIISDTYEHFDALTACFPWCTTTTARCIPRGSRSISLEPHVKSLHLTLAYLFPGPQYSTLKSHVESLDPGTPCNWELRLYSRDPRVNNKQVHKVICPYNATEADELDLQVGDYVYINSEALSSSSDGWVEGTSWQTGQTGLLPESYTERTAESETWTLHKKISLNQEENSSKSSPQRLPKESEMYYSTGSNNDDYNIQDNKVDFIKKLEQNMTDETEQNDSIQRSIFIARHGERVDFTFGKMWLSTCFDTAGNYTRQDLNMPKTVPKRSTGPAAYLTDSPLTNVGVYQAYLVGESLKDANVQIDIAYASPAYRCIQTCDAILKGLGLRDKIRINVEPGLFEWLNWYKEHTLEWLTTKEIINAGYNINEEYNPLVSVQELKPPESYEQYYLRKGFITREALRSHPTGNILIVGHSSSLETCSHELLGKKPKTLTSFMKALSRVPYVGLAHLSKVGDKWEAVEPPCLPITHTPNQTFDWKLMLE